MRSGTAEWPWSHAQPAWRSARWNARDEAAGPRPSDVLKVRRSGESDSTKRSIRRSGSDRRAGVAQPAESGRMFARLQVVARVGSTTARRLGCCGTVAAPVESHRIRFPPGRSVSLATPASSSDRRPSRRPWSQYRQTALPSPLESGHPREPPHRLDNRRDGKRCTRRTGLACLRSGTARTPRSSRRHMPPKRWLARSTTPASRVTSMIWVTPVPKTVPASSSMMRAGWNWPRGMPHTARRFRSETSA